MPLKIKNPQTSQNSLCDCESVSNLGVLAFQGREREREREMGRRILNDALRSIVNAEKRGKATVELKPISNVISSFLKIMKDRGKSVLLLSLPIWVLYSSTFFHWFNKIFPFILLDSPFIWNSGGFVLIKDLCNFNGLVFVYNICVCNVIFVFGFWYWSGKRLVGTSNYDVIMLGLPEMVDTELLECLELEKDVGLSILFLPIKFLMEFVLEIWYYK